MAPTRVSIEVSNYDYDYIISKLVYDLFLGLTTYLYGRYNPFTKYHGHPECFTENVGHPYFVSYIKVDEKSI